ncbi:hypothetical protein Tco_0613961 [Tanacetum coccineum]
MRTSENTSQGNSDSAHIGVNLNDEAADSEDVEAQEVLAPIGRDRAKKKGSSSGARSKTSIAGDPILVDALLSKFTMAATPFFIGRRSEPTKKNDKEFVKLWTIEEEIALCKAFVAKSEDSVEGNGKKAARIWREVVEHFHEEMGEDKRSYDLSNPTTLDEAFSLACAAEARFTNQQLWELLRSYPLTLGEAFFRTRIIEARFEDENNQAVDTNVGDQEDPDVKNKQENQDDPNIAIPDQVLEESILHTSDKSGISGLVPQLRDAKDEALRAMLDATALKAKLNSLQLQVINDDLGVITSRGAPSYHMQTSEKEFDVLKSPLDQRLNDLYIKKKKMKAAMQRRLWDPRIKIYFRHHLEDKVVVKEWGMIRPRFG